MNDTSQTTCSVSGVSDDVRELYKDILHKGHFYAHMIASRDRFAMLALTDSLKRQGWVKQNVKGETSDD